MNVKKIILFALLLLSVASLVFIVISAKDRRYVFGRMYDQYVSNRNISLAAVVNSNLSQVEKEVSNIAVSGLTKSVFVSAALGENTARFQPDFESINKGISESIKIQVMDSDGKVIYSTLPEEIYSQKIRDVMLDKIKGYFKQKKGMMVYFLDTNQMVAIYPYKTVEQSGQNDGYVSVYYYTRRIMQGEKSKYRLPYSYDNYIFVSASSVNKDDIARIVNNYKPGEYKSKKDKPTVAAVSSVKGLQVVYYSATEKYTPPIVFIFLLVNFLLLGLVLFVLIRMMAEEKNRSEDYTLRAPRANSEEQYRPSWESYGKSDYKPSFAAQESGVGINGLVDDINEERRFDESEARQGIEEMILSNDMDLTAMPVEEEIHLSSMADDNIAVQPEMELEMPSSGTDEFVITTDDERGRDFTLETSDAAGKPIEVSRANDFFAEHERVMNNIELPADDFIVGAEHMDNGSATPDSALSLEEPVLDNAPGSEELPEIPVFSDISAGEAESAPEWEKPVQAEEEAFSINPDIQSLAENGLSGLEESPVVSENDIEMETTGPAELPPLDLPDLSSISMPGEESEPLAETINLAPEHVAGEISMDDIAPVMDMNEVVEGAETLYEPDLSSIPEVEQWNNVDDDIIQLDVNELASIPVDLPAEDKFSAAPAAESMTEPLPENLEPITIPGPDELEMSPDIAPEKMEISLPDTDFEIPALDLDEKSGPAGIESLGIQGSEPEFIDISPAPIEMPVKEPEPIMPISLDDEPITVSLPEIDQIDLDSASQNSGLEIPALEQELSQDIPSMETEMEAAPELPEFPDNGGMVEVNLDGFDGMTQAGDASKPIDFKAVFSEPPVRMNMISDVESYADNVVTLAKNTMHMDKVFVLQRDGERFVALPHPETETPAFAFDTSDPLYTRVLSSHKSLDVKGNLDKTEYLTDKFGSQVLSGLDEMLIVPIVKNNIVEGIAFYGRNESSPEPKRIEKAELYNLGFLRDN